MITNIKIKATAAKIKTQEQIMRDIEAGKLVTELHAGSQHHLKIELDTDIDTIKRIVSTIGELGKSGDSK